MDNNNGNGLPTAKEWLIRWLDKTEERVKSLEEELSKIKIKVIGYGGLAGGVIAMLIKLLFELTKKG